MCFNANRRYALGQDGAGSGYDRDHRAGVLAPDYETRPALTARGLSHRRSLAHSRFEPIDGVALRLLGIVGKPEAQMRTTLDQV